MYFYVFIDMNAHLKNFHCSTPAVHRLLLMGLFQISLC